MPTLITLDIFSGRPNPTWELTEEQTNKFKDKIYALTEKTKIKSPGALQGLGYRGFIITTTGEKDLPDQLYVSANMVDFGWTRETFVSHDNDIEKWLLDTGAHYLDPDIYKYTQQDITGAENSYDSISAKSVSILSAPPYNPGWWNNDPTRLRNNNCYNYGCDSVTNSFAQPGRGSGRMYGAIDCAEVGGGATRDGLISVPNVASTPARGHYAALVVGLNWDFHWYRRDDNGMWSHKPGSTPVINYDNSHAPIADPQTANRGRYTIFCGYYNVIPGSIRLL